jgi:hypothetical protein
MKKPRSNQRIYSILIVCEVVLDRFSHLQFARPRMSVLRARRSPIGTFALFSVNTAKEGRLAREW